MGGQPSFPNNAFAGIECVSNAEAGITAFHHFSGDATGGTAEVPYGRVTGGTNGTNATEKLNTRSPSANAPGGQPYSVDPTFVANALFYLVRPASATTCSTRGWKVPNPRYPFILIDVEKAACIQGAGTYGFGVHWHEPSLDRFIGDRSRRSRRGGYSHYQSFHLIMYGDVTAPFANPGLASPSYVQTLDWPETINQAASQMNLLLSPPAAASPVPPPLVVDFAVTRASSY
jgi:hypothetical protein